MTNKPSIGERDKLKKILLDEANKIRFLLSFCELSPGVEHELNQIICILEGQTQLQFFKKKPVTASLVHIGEDYCIVTVTDPRTMKTAYPREYELPLIVAKLFDAELTKEL